jgi:hypothetical protein
MYETDEKFPLTSRFLLLFLAKYFEINRVRLCPETRI